MQATRRVLDDKPRALILGSLAVIAIHLVNASLFHLEDSVLERIAWAALSVFGVAVAAAAYGSLSNAGKGLLALAFGVPAVSFGLGIHAAHVYELGVEESSYTGVPMLVAGVILLVTGMTILVRSVHDWWRRLFFAPAAVVLLIVVFPVTLAIFATNVPVVECCVETPADRGMAYEDVSFETERGLTLSAWLVPSQNGATIITVHGAGKNRATVLDEAEMLARHGYGVLMLDLEGFGDSDGRANAFGWVGARDIHAATAYLASRPDVDPSRIGGLGLSMGGEVLLQAAGESTALKAVVAEGATGRTADDFGEAKAGGGQMRVFHTVVGTTMRLISGEETPPPLM
ncbi:MAG TPA: alpha/beta fold hydrolase, partial [Dehalococcoidia bacterium]|nr:alpha/beta fold hydrolase [Dehalococcoidia bacterium]